MPWFLVVGAFRISTAGGVRLADDNWSGTKELFGSPLIVQKIVVARPRGLTAAMASTATTMSLPFK
jgi:hypothetical protein